MLKKISHRLNEILKLNKWWVYKIGSGVFTFILFKYLLCGKSLIACVTLQDLMLFAVLFLLALIGHFINDMCDFEDDNRVGKPNIVNATGYKPTLSILASAILLVLGISFWFLPAMTLPFVAFQIFCCVLYSVKPFRWKEKGFRAVLLTGMYERALPYWIIVVGIGAFPNKIMLFSIVYICWSYLWECRNFINGQLKDYDDDLRTGTRSFVIVNGLAHTQETVAWIKVFEVLAWLAWMILLPHQDVTFAFWVVSMLVPVIHGSLNPRSGLLRFHERFLDYMYNYGLLAGLLISLTIFGKLNWAIAAGLLLTFMGSHSTFLVICNKLRHLYQRHGVRIFYSFRYVASKIVNYSIYYFRRYVLKWTEARSRNTKQ